MFSTMGLQLRGTYQHVMRRLRVGDTVPFIVVDKVAETGRVNDRQTKADAALLDV